MMELNFTSIQSLGIQELNWKIFTFEHLIIFGLKSESSWSFEECSLPPDVNHHPNQVQAVHQQYSSLHYYLFIWNSYGKSLRKMIKCKCLHTSNTLSLAGLNHCVSHDLVVCQVLVLETPLWTTSFLPTVLKFSLTFEFPQLLNFSFISGSAFTLYH